MSGQSGSFAITEHTFPFKFSIAVEGRIGIIGFAGGKIPKIPANILLVKSCSAVGVWWGSYATRNPPVFQVSGYMWNAVYHSENQLGAIVMS